MKKKHKSVLRRAHAQTLSAKGYNPCIDDYEFYNGVNDVLYNQVKRSTEREIYQAVEAMYHNLK